MSTILCYICATEFSDGTTHMNDVTTHPGRLVNPLLEYQYVRVVKRKIKESEERVRKEGKRKGRKEKGRTGIRG